MVVDLEFLAFSSSAGSVAMVPALKPLPFDAVQLAAALLDSSSGLPFAELAVLSPSKVRDFSVSSFAPRPVEPSPSALAGCLHYLLRAGLIGSGDRDCEFEVGGAGVICSLTRGGRCVRVDLGRPRLESCGVEALNRLIPGWEGEAPVFRMEFSGDRVVAFVDDFAKFSTAAPVEDVAASAPAASVLLVCCRSDRELAVARLGAAEDPVLDAAVAAVAGVEGRVCCSEVVVEVGGRTVEITYDPNRKRVFVTPQITLLSEGKIFGDYLKLHVLRS